MLPENEPHRIPTAFRTAPAIGLSLSMPGQKRGTGESVPWRAFGPAVAQIIGYMKGKSSIWIAQNVERKMRNFLGHKFWARGYFVTTVGRDEEEIRAYIRNQELADRQLEQFELKISAAKNPNNRPNIP